MKKEKQIGVRVGLPAFFCLELEDIYKHAEGAHRALAFPDFVGLLVGMVLETYKQRYALSPSGAEPENEPPETEGAGFWDFPAEPKRRRASVAH
jgi:hypothetical protein